VAGLSPQIEAAIERTARARGIDPATLRAFVMIESGGRPDVTTGSYRGLLQLSPQQFREHGGQGDIYDPQANLDAGAGKLSAMTQRFQQRNGRPPSSAELYLMHQQGEGGAAAHSANPSAPAWQNMASTAEGRQKGEEWAKRAIWGNVPNDVKARYGSVDNLTSADFMKMWGDKVARFSGGPQEPQGSPVTPVSQSPVRTASAQGNDAMLPMLAQMLGMAIPGMGTAAAAGSTMAGGGSAGAGMGGSPMGGGTPFSMGGGGGGAPSGPQGDSAGAQSAMRTAAGQPDQSMFAGPAQAQRPVDLQSLMASLAKRQKLGLGG
jgi:hypothetical protein